MKFSENWLRSMANPSLSREGLSHVLTMAGLEVEELEPVAPDFSSVVVAQIMTAEKHPDADRLQVLSVDVGQPAPLQIVCGAANARAGMKAPCALVGAKLPGFEIKQAKVRGVESYGMMCSEKELGLAEESAGLMELPVDAPVGDDIRTFLDLDDALFTLKLTPNRSDCLSVAGIAREVSALTGCVAQLPVAGATVINTEARKAVTLASPEACPRYSGRIVRGVDATASTPTWMRRRLERSGLRSISAIVDVTNYVLLELGQPLHAFDLAKLQGNITVRFAKAGEQLELLNQQSVELQTDDLIIADDRQAVALAGIMGGASTAVNENTTDIFLESAFFSPAALAGKARRLGFSTDSSYRFERGVDFAATVSAMERATQLIQQICGGQAGPVTEAYSELPPRPAVDLRVERINRVLGIFLDEQNISELLSRLGMPFTPGNGKFSVTPASWRFDIEREEDLIEEVARLHGYEKIQPAATQAVMRMLPVSESSRNEASVRSLLAASDYQEVITYSFVEEDWEREFSGNPTPVKLRNPIASDMSVMRSSLFGGLLNVLTYNLNRKQSRVRLFEIGACFHVQGQGYAQQLRLGGLCYGEAVAEQWGEAPRGVDFYDVKADIEAVMGSAIRFERAQHPALHPGQCAKIIANGRAVGFVGTLHPRWQQKFDLSRAAVLFEIDLQALLQTVVPVFDEVPRFPPIRRDIAVIVDEKVAVQDMLDALRENSEKIISDVSLFDVYRGKGIAENKKSLAFLVLMQDTEKTLTDEDADSVMKNLIAELNKKFGAVLRS